MSIIDAIQKRHSVRRYTGQNIEGDVLAALQAEVKECNHESGLNIQLITNDPETFNNFLAKYGKFSGVKHYLAIVGEKSPSLEEKAGYYGERIVLKAQQLGLNTCWVALTFSKRKCAAVINKGEKLVCVISIGYGETQGVARKSKPLESLCKTDGDMPGWFRSGMEAALLAPTAVNQQKFFFTLSGSTVKAVVTGGIYSKLDLGIVKYHFEAGAGMQNFTWGD